MHNYYHNLFYSLIAVLIMIFSFGCRSNIEAPKTNYPPAVKEIRARPALPSKNDESAIDFVQEESIEKMCLQAWRKCVAGNKNAGIADLKRLNKQYPKSASVLFMTGQALEKFGNRKEAIAYYEKAADNSDFAVMSLFKIAESLRTAGSTKQAIERYKKLISIAPQFALAHLGLAKALIQLDPSSAEAKKELKTALELDPNIKEAQDLLHSYKSP